MAEYEKRVREKLKEYGCYFVRHGKGSHDIWHSPLNDEKRNCTELYPIKAHSNAILKEAGIKEKF
ncbi:addiction module toxin, HicA family protein [Clostridia bacterium]|nr:addiction module toxin, HicA family protein [Clostridia bacterium]